MGIDSYQRRRDVVTQMGEKSGGCQNTCRPLKGKPGWNNARLTGTYLFLGDTDIPEELGYGK